MSEYYDHSTGLPLQLVKIGYCDDSRKDKRMSKYKTENPLYIPLYYIEGGTKQHESLIHNKFKKYLAYGNEWFNWNDEIQKFFNTIKSLEDLDYYFCITTESKPKEVKVIETLKPKNDTELRKFLLIGVYCIFVDDYSYIGDLYDIKNTLEKIYSLVGFTTGKRVTRKEFKERGWGELEIITYSDFIGCGGYFTNISRYILRKNEKAWERYLTYKKKYPEIIKFFRDNIPPQFIVERQDLDRPLLESKFNIIWGSESGKENIYGIDIDLLRKYNLNQRKYF